MAKEVYVCDICKFAYENEKLAKDCEKWCRSHNSCSLQISKSAVGVLNPLK